jgi:branched-chain amino acid transport system permease protein
LILVLAAVGLVYAALERMRPHPSVASAHIRRTRSSRLAPSRTANVAVPRLPGDRRAGLAGVLFAHYLAYVEPNMFLPQESLFVWLALILGGSGNNRGALLGSLVLLGLLEGSRFAKDVIPFLTGVRLAAAQQILVGVVLVTMMIRRPEGLLPEKPGSG